MAPRSWLDLAFVLTATALLYDGLKILFSSARPRHIRELGALSLLIVVLGGLGLWWVASGQLVFSPEFGVLLVEGGEAAPAIRLLLVGVAVVAGLIQSPTREVIPPGPTAEV